MVFNPNIPAATDDPSQSQSQMLTNFNLANTYFGVNHVAFNAASDQGKHNFSTYVDQGGDPATAVNEIALYSKDVGGNSTLFLRKENNGAVVQMSNLNPVSAANGYTFLPGALLLQWGTATLIALGDTTVNFPITFSAQAYSVIINLINLPAATIIPTLNTGTISATSFQVSYNGVVNTDIYWMAIGPKA